MKPALVAFRGTVGARVAEQAGSGCACFEVSSTVRDIERLCATGALAEHTFIIGLGVYTGAGRDFVHVETCCFDEQGGGKRYALDTTLADGNLFRASATIKRSWCNMLAASLSKHQGSSRVAFLHIPSGLDISRVAKHIRKASHLLQDSHL